MLEYLTLIYCLGSSVYDCLVASSELINAMKKNYMEVNLVRKVNELKNTTEICHSP